MDTDVRFTRQRAGTAPNGAASCLRLHERVAIAVLVTAVSSWIRVVEILPDNRRRG
jgi:hypothetical protein